MWVSEGTTEKKKKNRRRQTGPGKEEEETGKRTSKANSAAGAKLARLEPVEHQPSLL